MCKIWENIQIKQSSIKYANFIQEFTFKFAILKFYFFFTLKI